MAVTMASLRANHPEFTDTPDAVVQDGIDKATAQLDSQTFGDLIDDATEWLACWLIVSSPYARDKKMSVMSSKATYLDHYQDIETAVTSFPGGEFIS